MKQIQLTKGKVAMVDDSDFEELNRFKWCAIEQKGVFRAMRKCRCPFGGKYHAIYMHRQIMSTPCGMETDHRNGDSLNNRRSNLRICTHTQNLQNQRRDPKKSSSCFKGVHRTKLTGKWQAYITQNGKRIHLGHFNNEIEAAKTYDAKAKELFGEFACLNFDIKEAC